MGFDGETACGGLHGHIHLHRVVLPMKIENSLHNEVAVDRLTQGSFDVAWPKSDQLVLIAAENILVHPVIARGVSTFSAGCVDLDQTTCCSCERVTVDVTLFHLECAVDGVHGIAERPSDRCRCRVKDDVDRVRGLPSGGSNKEQQQAGQKENSKLADSFARSLHYRTPER